MSLHLKDLDTYVYIDVSNIRNACLQKFNLDIDFIRLYRYFAKKYPNLKDVRYYEGISNNDPNKGKHFDFLHHEIGYTVCALPRHQRVEPAQYHDFDCAFCGQSNHVEIQPRTVRLKSNVDIYLVSDMLELSVTAEKPVHVVILSCDGDYCEAIKSLIRLSPDSHVTVLAASPDEHDNSLSIRLKELCIALDQKNYSLDYIDDLKDRVLRPPHFPNK